MRFAAIILPNDCRDSLVASLPLNLEKMREEFKSKMEAERQLSSSKIVLAKPKSLQLDK